MNIRSVIGAACAAVAIAAAMPAAAHDVGDVVPPNSEQAIPDIPGKSLIAVVVDYPPGGASLAHTHAKSAFIFYVLAGEIESQVNDGPKRVYRAGESFYETPVPAILSAAMQARLSPQSCWPSSSSIPTTKP